MPNIVTIGLFDGVHKGHQALLRATGERSERSGLPAVVLTFEGLENFKDCYLINTPEDNSFLIGNYIDRAEIRRLPFSRKLQKTTAEEFFYGTLLQEFDAGHIIVGENFTFGSDRKSTDYLAALCHRAGVGFTILPTQTDAEHRVISSTSVRHALISGKVEEANLLLGHCHYHSGEVIHGRQIGRELGFPTLNISYEKSLVPMKRGVYATVALLHNGLRCPSVTNLGIRPTFDPSETPVPMLETHLIGMRDDFYGQHVGLYFKTFLRHEESFTDISFLRAQIRRDEMICEKYFRINGV